MVHSQIDLHVFFTLTDGDLMLIGIHDEQDRGKILDFLSDFRTPDKKQNKARDQFLQPPPRH